MKFKFKIQQYQTDAVQDTIFVFTGQPSHDAAQLYRRDLGKQQQGKIVYEEEYAGYRNHDVVLTPKQILNNINTIQAINDIKPSRELSKGLGSVNLDIEMETGTGKTYVYIKTMFELNRRYGWSKFIVVVPSIAIREGVAKSFRMLEEHFMEHYGRKARWFIYNSSNLQQLDSFSADAGLNVMIINTQAFASSLKEDGRSKESRIIYSKRDEFGSRRPIDVIGANRPIIIMDEPQKMEGDATQTALKKFKPLFVLNYSATHKTKHDTIYALDALDAYRQKLVKRIHVKGFEVKNLRGTSAYIYLDNILLSPKRPPQVRLELLVKNAAGEPKRRMVTLNQGDSLFAASRELAVYQGMSISEIIPNGAGFVRFTNDEVIRRGEVVGDTNELTMQRVQIRETIMSHFEKERKLFRRGIKCLSLFFIDEVAKYKSYDENGNEVKGVFQEIFEEEYTRILNEELNLFDEEYTRYLRSFTPQQVHNGYFSIDKKGHAIDSKAEKKSGLSDDISAYDLILKNKERLLSFEEPTRFIFSHSALREGWDNPNVFQICTLRHSNSTTAKRQEVGRGLRICVDRNGTRMDAETLGDEVHEVNKLTVIANESYADFTSALQRETREVLRERTEVATSNYFAGKKILVGGEPYTISDIEASHIMTYLDDNGYIDGDGHLTAEYHAAMAAESLAPYGKKLQHIAGGVTKLINSIFDPTALDDITKDEHETKIPDLSLNKNFDKEEFKALWREINHQYVYTVSYDSEELIEKSVIHINAELDVTRLRYVVVEGTQADDEVTEFGDTHTRSREMSDVCTSTVKYDLVGDIAKGATLTRRSVVKILQRINASKLSLFRNNPEEFIRKVIKIIKEQKATMIVEHIHYNQVDGSYDSEIFTSGGRPNYDKAIEVQKHITDYLVADSDGERRFARELDAADEVVVYAKLPRSFQIPTPVGNYAPDWAIAFKKGTVKHIFFIAETKGSMDSMQISPIESAKIACAEQLFNTLSTDNVRYHKVTSFSDLIELMPNL
jgi:type III restriction enzyme